MTDKKVSPSRDAQATRHRILDAAKVLFSQTGYEGVGVREIAREAEVDPALINRYFSGKEGLFRQVAKEAFTAGDFLSQGAQGLTEQLVAQVLAPPDAEAWRQGYDPFRLLLCSIANPLAGPIIAQHLQQDFINPLADVLAGEQAPSRAALLTAQILGVALVRIVQDSSSASSDDLQGDAITQRLCNSLQACILPDKT